MKTRILLTGATGYIGGRLLKLLEAEGFPVRCITRRMEFLQRRVGSSTEIVAGDVLDCWRVEAFEPGRKLRLAAEMKMPGRAWLEFEVAGEAGGSIIRQTAIFDPVGLWGLMYWYLVYSLHQLVFAGMLRGIAHAVDHRSGKP